jgi:adenylate cyclase
MTFPRLPAELRLILWITAISAVIGAIYALIVAVPEVGADNAIRAMSRGMLSGVVTSSLLSSIETLGFSGPLGAPFRRLPFLLHVTIKTLIYLAVILFGLTLAGSVFPFPGEAGIRGKDILASLAISFVFVFILDINTLLGQNVLLNFITGRYHHPRLEHRVLLFVDMEGSTGLAERLGPLAFHRLLNRFVTDLTEPIVAARGEIYSYVGDELIATWRLKEGLAEGRCVHAVLAALDRLQRNAADYRREFGSAVNFRAGLHCGPLVTGEMGTVKREIVFLGDTVNTAARIQDFCRQSGDRVLASADLVDRLDLPPGVAKRSLGDLRLRGKGEDIALYALTAAPQRARPAKDNAGRATEQEKV